MLIKKNAITIANQQTALKQLVLLKFFDGLQQLQVLILAKKTS